MVVVVADDFGTSAVVGGGVVAGGSGGAVAAEAPCVAGVFAESVTMVATSVTGGLLGELGNGVVVAGDPTIVVVDALTIGAVVVVTAPVAVPAVDDEPAGVVAGDSTLSLESLHAAHSSTTTPPAINRLFTCPPLVARSPILETIVG